MTICTPTPPSYVHFPPMDVPITELRARLADWIGHARSGEEVVITDRGVPVARLVSIDSAPILERLAAEGVIGPADRAHRPVAAGRSRVRPQGPVSSLISEGRR